MKRLIAIWLLLIGALPTTMAQPQTVEREVEWIAWGGYGTSSLLYDMYGGSLTQGTGNNLGIGGVIAISTQWGILVGAELQGCASKVYSNQLIDSHQATANSVSTSSDTSSKNSFLYTATYDHFREQQEVSFLNIPVMARFGFGELPLYAMVGAKLGIPVQATFTTTASTLTTTGYFAYDYLTLTQQPEYGFGEESNYKASGSLPIGWQLALSGEVGYQMSITSRSALYLALYIDCGINDLYREATAQNELLTYNASNPTSPIQHSLLSTQQNHISLSSYSYNKVTTLSGGVKIAFGFTTIFKEQPKKERFTKQKR